MQLRPCNKVGNWQASKALEKLGREKNPVATLIFSFPFFGLILLSATPKWVPKGQKIQHSLQPCCSFWSVLQPQTSIKTKQNVRINFLVQLVVFPMLVVKPKSPPWIVALVSERLLTRARGASASSSRIVMTLILASRSTSPLL